MWRDLVNFFKNITVYDIGINIYIFIAVAVISQYSNDLRKLINHQSKVKKNIGRILITVIVSGGSFVISYNFFPGWTLWICPFVGIYSIRIFKTATSKETYDRLSKWIIEHIHEKISSMIASGKHNKEVESEKETENESEGSE